MTKKYYRPTADEQKFVAGIACFQRLFDKEVERLTTQTPNTMKAKSTKGKDLAWDIATRLRANQFKDMTLGEIDDFRAEMAKFLDLKKEW